MDLTTQVRNHYASVRNNRPSKPRLVSEDKPEWFHEKALQALSNGLDVPFEATLRRVDIEGSASPLLPPRVTRKHPGYTRNESGGLFTS